jgi:hypothetical protein
MDLFEFTGKLLFEDTPKLLFEKLPQTLFEDIPEACENGLDAISDAIDNLLD